LHRKQIKQQQMSNKNKQYDFAAGSRPFVMHAIGGAPVGEQ